MAAPARNGTSVPASSHRKSVKSASPTPQKRSCFRSLTATGPSFARP